jgi:hypothetical protein
MKKGNRTKWLINLINFISLIKTKLSKQLTDNKMKKGNRTKNDLQNTTQKTRN